MQKKHILQFGCLNCKNPINFSIFDLDTNQGIVLCPQCSKKYAFKDENLKRQLNKFQALCSQLIESEEILSNTAVGIDIGEHHVKVPYRLLLTRLNSTLDLQIGDQKLSITFRLEPRLDLQETLLKPDNANK